MHRHIKPGAGITGHRLRYAYAMDRIATPMYRRATHGPRRGPHVGRPGAWRRPGEVRGGGVLALERPASGGVGSLQLRAPRGGAMDGLGFRVIYEPVLASHSLHQGAWAGSEATITMRLRARTWIRWAPSQRQGDEDQDSYIDASFFLVDPPAEELPVRGRLQVLAADDEERKAAPPEVTLLVPLGRDLFVALRDALQRGSLPIRVDVRVQGLTRARGPLEWDRSAGAALVVEQIDIHFPAVHPTPDPDQEAQSVVDTQRQANDRKEASHRARVEHLLGWAVGLLAALAIATIAM